MHDPIPPGHGEPAGPGPMPRCPECATVIDTYLAAGTGDGKGRCPEHGLVTPAYGEREALLRGKETVVLAMDVIAYRFPSAEVAEDRWHELQAEAVALGAGEANYSCWRVADPDGEGNVIVVCGSPEVLAEVEVGGEPFDIGLEAATTFLERRLAIMFDNREATEPVTQIAHYGERGAYLREGGRMEPRR